MLESGDPTQERLPTGDLRYICLSDMHFGADNSVMTRLSPDRGGTDPGHPSDVLVQLVTCLRHLPNANTGAAKPVLILNRDISDLTFASESGSALAFQRFLELGMPEDPAARQFDPAVIHIPGNHDHHLWEACRGRRFVDGLHPGDRSAPMPPTTHTTAMRDPVQVTSDVMQTLARRLLRLSGVTVGTVYPNLAFANAARLVVFTPGHFIEDAYLTVSALAQALFPSRLRLRRCRNGRHRLSPGSPSSGRFSADPERSATTSRMCTRSSRAPP